MRRDDLEGALQDADHVVHLAAETGTGQSMYEIARYDHVNSYGTALLLDVLANRPHRVKKIVLSSSRSVYGEGQHRCERHGVVQPAPRPAARLKAAQWETLCPACGAEVTPVATRETAAPKPASIYAATKLAQEELVRIACTAMGIPYVNSDSRTSTDRASPSTTRTRESCPSSPRAFAGAPTCPIFEDGKPSRDFVHVADVARAVVAQPRVRPGRWRHPERGLGPRRPASGGRRDAREGLPGPFADRGHGPVPPGRHPALLRGHGARCARPPASTPA